MLRNVCFTLFDFESDELKFNDKVQYAVWQVEKAPSTEKEHLQGYIEFKSPVRFGAIKKLLGESVHIEARKGTQEQAINYCKKEDTRLRGPFEYGEPKLGHRPKVNQLTAAVQVLKEGGLSAVAAEFPEVYIRNFKGLSSLSNISVMRRTEKTQVTVIIGPSGSGKSRKAWDEYPNAYPKNNSQWWDGYNGTDPIIWDDYADGCIPYEDLLRIMDRYPMLVPVKGATINFAPKVLIFTMMKIPHKYDIQFHRRVDNLVDLSDDAEAG